MRLPPLCEGSFEGFCRLARTANRARLFLDGASVVPGAPASVANAAVELVMDCKCL